MPLSSTEQCSRTSQSLDSIVGTRSLSVQPDRTSHDEQHNTATAAAHDDDTSTSVSMVVNPNATDNSSLHFHMNVIERIAKNAKIPNIIQTRMRFADGLPQIWASIIINLLPMQAGVNMVYSNLLIPQLSAPLAEIHITKTEASWIGRCGCSSIQQNIS